MQPNLGPLQCLSRHASLLWALTYVVHSSALLSLAELALLLLICCFLKLLTMVSMILLAHHLSGHYMTFASLIVCPYLLFQFLQPHFFSIPYCHFVHHLHQVRRWYWSSWCQFDRSTSLNWHCLLWILYCASCVPQRPNWISCHALLQLQVSSILQLLSPAVLASFWRVAGGLLISGRAARQLFDLSLSTG